MEYYDFDKNGEISDNEIASMLKDLYKGIDANYRPTQADVSGLKQVFDRNGDGRVTAEDLQATVDRYLSVDNTHGIPDYYPFAKSAISFNQNPLTFDSRFGRTSEEYLQRQVNGNTAVRDYELGLDNARKIFKQYDRNQNKQLERSEILPIIFDTFKLLNKDTLPSREDIDLYLGMMDGNGDRNVSMQEFETFFVKAAQRRNLYSAAV